MPSPSITSVDLGQTNPDGGLTVAYDQDSRQNRCSLAITSARRKDTHITSASLSTEYSTNNQDRQAHLTAPNSEHQRTFDNNWSTCDPGDDSEILRPACLSNESNCNLHRFFIKQEKGRASQELRSEIDSIDGSDYFGTKTAPTLIPPTPSSRSPSRKRQKKSESKIRRTSDSTESEDPETKLPLKKARNSSISVKKRYHCSSIQRGNDLSRFVSSPQK